LGSVCWHLKCSNLVDRKILLALIRKQIKFDETSTLIKQMLKQKIVSHDEF